MSKIFKNLIAILAVVAIITSTPVIASAPTRTMPTKVLSVQETISYYAELHGASEKQLMAVAKCESSFKPAIKGDGGRAFGIFQYHRPTFNAFSKLMGQKLDYYSYSDQAKLTAWIWVHYPSYKSHWTCTKIVGIV